MTARRELSAQSLHLHSKFALVEGHASFRGLDIPFAFHAFPEFSALLYHFPTWASHLHLVPGHLQDKASACPALSPQCLAQQASL